MNPPFDPKVLAQRELAIPGRYTLHEAAPAPLQPSLWDRFISWLGDLLGQIWKALFGQLHVPSSASAVIGDAIAIIVAAIVLLVTIRLIVGLQVERNARLRTANSALDAGRDAQELYQRATELARRGEYSAAARMLFVAAVVALDLGGLVRDDASSTVGEVRRRLRAEHTSLVKPFDDVARAFVAAAYAESPIGSTEWETASQGYRALTGTVPS